MSNFSSLLRRNWYLFLVLVILLLATLVRFYKLGEIPHGMTWDEAAIGYNGFAVFNTRRDEWLTKLPVSFLSFGDYKAPLAIYINGVFTNFLGMNLMAVRFPFAIASIFAILGAMLLSREIFKKNQNVKYYSLFTGFLMTLSPWHFHYSRVGFESGMALSFLIWALLFTIKTRNEKFKNILISTIAAVFYSASIYTYHSSKVVVPLILILFFVFNYKNISKHLNAFILPLTIFFISLVPFIKDSIFGGGLTRAGVTVFSSQISLLEKLLYVLNSYLVHLSPNFLLFGQTTTLRHGTGYLGVLFLTTLMLVLLGVLGLFINKQANKDRLLLFGLMIIGLLPACISMEVPHPNRALLALPGFIFLAVYGLDLLIKSLERSELNKKASGSKSEKNILVKSVVGTLLLAHTFFFIAFISNYFSVFANDSADAFKDGYLDTFEIVKKYEDGLDGFPQVDKIIFTSDYGQPYIYALFARKTNPIWYQGGSLIKYEFNETVNIGDLMRNNALVVGSKSDDLPIKEAEHLIYGSDGELRFQIYLTKNEN